MRLNDPRLLELLLWAKVSGVATLLLAAVSGTQVVASIAPGWKKASQLTVISKERIIAVTVTCTA